jgi:hypothetical protein
MKRTSLRRKRQDWLALNPTMCPSGVTSLSAVCCFSELALFMCWSSTKRTSSSSHGKLTAIYSSLGEHANHFTTDAVQV